MDKDAGSQLLLGCQLPTSHLPRPSYHLLIGKGRNVCLQSPVGWHPRPSQQWTYRLYSFFSHLKRRDESHPLGGTPVFTLQRVEDKREWRGDPVRRHAPWGDTGGVRVHTLGAEPGESVSLEQAADAGKGRQAAPRLGRDWVPA